MYDFTDENSVGPDFHHCSLTFYEDTEEKLRPDLAYVSAELWRNLLFFSGQDGEDIGRRLAISVAPSTNDLPVHGANSITGSTFWISYPAISPVAPPFDIAVPSTLKHCFAPISGQEKTLCNVTLVHPLQLLEVFVSTHDPEVFRLAQQHPEIIERTLCEDQRILRTGDRVRCIEKASDFALDGKEPIYFSISMAEPVLQGFAKAGQTRFLVALRSSGDDQILGSESDVPDEHWTEAFQSLSSDEFAIDENFLASSALGLLTSSTGSTLEACITSRHEKGIFLRSIDALSLKAVRSTFDCKIDDGCTVFAHTDVLGKIGVFNGDWAVMGYEEDQRLVRVCGSLHLPPTDFLYAAPILIRNCFDKKSDVDALPVRISPFGAGPPFAPTANSVTLARIASPSSGDRANQNSQFMALKNYFERHLRLIKKGDLIAVPLCMELGDILKRSINDEESAAINDDLLPGIANVDLQPNAVVFFLVTALEFDVVQQGSSEANKDVLIGCAQGHFGCWLDSLLTKVVQSGVEHSDVPDIVTYLGKSMPSTLKCQSEGFTSNAYRRLTEVLEASSRGNIDFGSSSAIIMIGPAGSSMTMSARQIANRLGCHLLNISAFDLLDETETKTAGKIKECFVSAFAASPCILLLEGVDAFLQSTQPPEPGKESTVARTFKKCLEGLYGDYKGNNTKVFVVATAESVDRLPPAILTCFKEQVNFEVPDEYERRSLLLNLTANDCLGADVSLRALATQTAALGVTDLLNLVQRARHAAMKRIFNDIVGTAHSSRDVVHSGLTLLGIDFQMSLAESRISYSQSIGAPSIPSVSWDDVGGLVSVKEDILDTIQLPLDHPELFDDGLKQRSGILLYGPPGTGKTLLAKAVATSCSLNFLSVKGPELLNMYIGESEANVRRIFQRARDAKPCVIFFDELDSIAPKRGNHGDSGGVMDRIVSQLLAELDGMSSSGQGADVFVIGATNRPDLLDPALLRPGRFDRMLYIGISDTHDSQLNILEALTRKFRLHPDLELMKIAELCPFNYTGADFYALCSDAMLKAMARKADEVQRKIDQMNLEPRISRHQYPLTPQYYLSELASPSDTDVLVNQGDFLEALKDLVPSVSQAELEHYKEVQKRFTQTK